MIENGEKSRVVGGTESGEPAAKRSRSEEENPVNSMSKIKLKALKYPGVDSCNPRDDAQFRSLVIWLEDQRVRHYKIEDRKELRDENLTEWFKGLQKYLNDLMCPYKFDEDRLVVTDWLLGYAIRLEYTDQVDKLKELTGEKVKQLRSEANKTVVSQNPLDNMDFNDPDFKAGTVELAKVLKINQHPDHLVVLKAISKLVQERLSVSAVEQSKQAKDTKDDHGKPIPLENVTLGFDTGDYVLNNACRIIRLLHVRELRELQTKINETIVAVQNITADPKTDERLGKVGFI